MAEQTQAETTTTAQEQAPVQETPEQVTDKHGQPGINLERHNREMAEKDAKIAELTAKVEEMAKNESGRAELKAEIEKLKASFDEERTTYKLDLAGCRNSKAAKALLPDYEGSFEKLKAAEPWLFVSEPKGTTGGKPVAATQDDDLEKMREAIGLKKRG